ncbi:hypothetical protein JKP88DRAFT_349459 [Tribonema minus]|uniref:Ribosomal RNA-processing protein 44 n=1 Tax=Tribonema minus TaxID=303371 RepID=A0A835Z1U7_9STRA|nr:hypothetical protein JKP88DRAFT_349459 [Tribonema minus]
MHRNKAFFKRTRRGKVLHIVNDHYLRDDIACGTLAGKELTAQDMARLASESAMKQLLVLDTNVVLNQMDLLDRGGPALSCVVVLQTVAEERGGPALSCVVVLQTWMYVLERGGPALSCVVALQTVAEEMDLLQRGGPALSCAVVMLTVAEEVRHNNLALYRRLRQLLMDESRVFIFFANEHHCESRVFIFFANEHHCESRVSIFFANEHHCESRVFIFFANEHHCELLMDESRAFIFFANEHHCDAYTEHRPGESPNDRNDRAIRVSAQWLKRQVDDGGEGDVGVVLLTNDRANRRIALGADITAMSIHKFIRDVSDKYPDLQDLLAAEAVDAEVEGGNDLNARRDLLAAEAVDVEVEGGSGNDLKARRDLLAAEAVDVEVEGGGGNDLNVTEGGERVAAKPLYPPHLPMSELTAGIKSGRGKNVVAKPLYPPHLPMSELTAGIKSGRLFQGTLRVERSNWTECYVIVQGLQEQERIAVYVRGPEHVNRAVDGDVVAIEMLPPQEWTDDRPGKQGAKENGTSAAATPADQEDSEEQKNLVPDITAPQAVEDLEGTVKVAANARPRGRVVGVIRRNWRQYCGSLEAHGDRETANGRTSSALLVPVDRKSPKVPSQMLFGNIPKVRIQTRQRSALEGKRIIVSIDSWPANCRFPLGHYLRTLGSSGDKSTETEVILLEHDIPHDAFSGKVLACLPPVDWQITAENSVGRRDMRHVPALSIDPPGCKDIDDALHARPLPNGNIEVGVHIADVTHFVQPGSAMDLEAANRSTSTYLVERRLDMLPGLLTETLCSLRGGEDRFAFTVLWEITPEGEIVEVDFFKSIIHSIASLTYNEAQMMIDDPNMTDVRATSVRQLNKLAKIFRKRRLDAGALTLASPEVRFVLDSESQNPTDVQMYALKEANALVEEFMLLANITVGKKILRHFPTLSVLRRHPAPSRQQFNGFLASVKAFDGFLASVKAVGFDLEVDDSKKLADSLDRAERADDPYFNKILRICATRCMTPAQYFCSGQKPQEEWHHYGLAAPIYTHFTSPIRRYADVLVHRLLGAAIGVGSLPLALMDKGYLHDLMDNLNRRHRAAQLAGRASVAMHTVLYFKLNPTEEEAYVLSVSQSKITVLVPRFGIEGTEEPYVLSVSQSKLTVLVPRKLTVLVTQRGIDGTIYLPSPDTLIHDADAQRVSAPAGSPCAGASVQVFDKVRVAIRADSDGESPRAVSMTLVTPSFGTQATGGDGTTGGDAPVAAGRKRKAGNAAAGAKQKTRA